MSSPATPHRSPTRGTAKSTPTKTKLPDIGKPLGIYDTTSVREKVRLWQQQGGGVITANDITVEDDGGENSSSRVKSGKDSEPRRMATRLKVEDRAPGVERSITRKRSSSTPKKRVVSDEHWRKQRSPPRTPQTKVPPPKRITVYETNDHFNTPSSSEKRDAKKDDGIRLYATPPSTWKRSRPAKTAKEDPNPDENSKIERDIKKNGPASASSSPSSKEASAKQPEESQVDETEGMRRTTPPPKDDGDWAASEADFSELSRRRRRGPYESRTVRKVPKGGILAHMLDESKKMFAKPAPPPTPPNRGDKIEAWLSATPDPFMQDHDDSSVAESPAPLNRRSKTARRSPRHSPASTTVEDLSEHSDGPHESGPRRKKSVRDSTTRRRSDDSAAASGDRRKSRSPSPLSEKEAKSSEKRKDKEESSPSNLKGTGAHKRVNSSSPPVKQPFTSTKHRGEEIQASDREFPPSSDGSEVSASEESFPMKLKRPFPSTGMHRLSTIASEETLSTRDEKLSILSKREISSNTQDSTSKPEDGKPEDGKTSEAEERDQFDPNSLPSSASGLKRRLTKHADLMSVLSDPNSSRRSVRSARSIRSNKGRFEKTTIDDLMQQLSADETKYMRELRTLVGGVIPVLLTCVLSRSDTAIAAGLFRPTLDPKDDINFTRPIVDMGVALERLKTLHKRIPLDNTDALLSWAQGAQRVYRDYLKAWRMGFQDVVVNLAPPDESETANCETQSLDLGMARDENGDIVNSDGEKVDVAYLLKRPLVRLKYLARTFKGIDTLAHSPKTEEVAIVYQELVEHARRRSREERARIEDESAARIDPTRARDPETLAVLTGVSINQTRRVLARDLFNLSLCHSSGQLVDCRAELLLRDNAPDAGPGGDLLICEISNTDRWLLFPPIETDCVSARKGDATGEIVVMIRGQTEQDRKWQELLSLTIDDEEIALEWVEMLGMDPVPPAICRTQSFVSRSKDRHRESIGQENAVQSSMPNKPRAPSPSAIDVPMGEQASVVSRAGKSSISHDGQSSGPSILSSSSARASRSSLVSAITRESDYALACSESSPKSLHHARTSGPPPGDPDDIIIATGDSPGLKRSKAKRISRHAGEFSPSGSQPRSSPTPDREAASPTTPKRSDRAHDETKRTPQSPRGLSPRDKTPEEVQERPSHHRVSSVPSMDLPTIKKIRKSSPNTTPLHTSADEEEWPDSRSSSHSKEGEEGEEEDGPPVPPPHRSPSPAYLKQQTIPILSPTFGRLKRRSSSPLKHEYEPSTPSESSSDSDTSTVRHYDMDSSSSSETSEEELEDEDDMPTPLPPTDDLPKPSSPPSLPTLDSDTLSPSSSASQGPYRTVPPQPSKSSKAIASIFSWSDKGSWESLFPDECLVVVSPGLIEAYEMTAKQANGNNDDEDDEQRERPLIALELTPLVPIRRGTAIDISIRSPPTERSRIKSSNNIMFRSRNMEECEALYNLINHARINNPTYIALQNARPQYVGQQTSLDSTQSDKRTSWFGFPRRKNSYRAPSKRAQSVGLASESSVGTMSTAFSALKRFGAGSKMFSIARSTITSRTGGSRDGSLYSSSLGSGRGSIGGAFAEAIKGADGIGLSNAKIRLYVRESVSKWRDLGAARLTIMPATPRSSRPGTAGSVAADANVAAGEEGEETDEPVAEGATTPTAAAPRRVATGPQEKRILIRGKTRGEVLLDVCLGESSFERVARTGIAVSVWEENEGGAVSKEGGVTGGSFRVYMIQMKSEAEAAYTFSLVGKLRY
ncbi:hypothetical protein VTN77DRAFT_7974 [Rasamsonia byssochlamydoides]|uniref:uncharacterized protein n=1 Tax=Rasamsonia byssochlamydoides TaxID=89139 RepID=UPI0037423B0D